MAFTELPKVKKRAKRPEALKRMSKETAERKFAEKVNLAVSLKKQLKKCERDITKYYLTMTKDR